MAAALLDEVAVRSHALTGRLDVLRELTAMLGRISQQEQTVSFDSPVQGLVAISKLHGDAIRQLVHWTAMAVEEASCELQMIRGEVDRRGAPGL